VPRDPVAAVRAYEQAAAGGRATALTKLGRLHERGSAGLAADPRRAARYYEQAVAAGDRHALAPLGDLYAAGRGVAADTERAAAFYQQSAERGEAGAYAKLGDLRAASDPAAAIGWYGEGAKRGDADALYRLGEAYEQGKGVAADQARALMYFQLAGRFGHARATERQAALARSLPPGAVQQAEQEAAGWLAAQGIS
jgi:TPR repeat protein